MITELMKSTTGKSQEAIMVHKDRREFKIFGEDCMETSVKMWIMIKG